MVRCNIYHTENNATRIVLTIGDVSPVFNEGDVFEVRVTLDLPDLPGVLLAQEGWVSRESDKI